MHQHLPLVGYIANDMLARVPGHVERDDLVSAGMLALVQASRAYDPSTGVPFAGYARTRIRGGILDELRSHDWAPRGVRARGREISRVEDALTAQLGRRPSTSELATAMGVSPTDVTSVRDDISRTILSVDAFDGSLDDQLGDDGATPEERLLHDERIAVLRAAVEALPERLRVVVSGVFFEERSTADIAAELGVTDSRVSQLRSEAMRLLRDGVNSHLDPQLVDRTDRPDGVVARRREAYYAEVASRAAYSMVPAVSATGAAAASGQTPTHVPVQHTA